MASQEEVEVQKSRLVAYRQTLATLLLQQALLGEANSPPGTANGIREARSHIARIKMVLRSWGEVVGDHPDDDLSISQVAADVASLRNDTADEIRRLKINAFRIHLTLPFESGKIRKTIYSSLSSLSLSISSEFAKHIIRDCIEPEVKAWVLRETLTIDEMKQKMANKTQIWRNGPEAKHILSSNNQWC